MHADRFEVRAWLHWFSTLKYGKIERNRSCQGNFKPPGHIVFAKAHFSASFSCTCVRRSLRRHRALAREDISATSFVCQDESREKLKKKKKEEKKKKNYIKLKPNSSSCSNDAAFTRSIFDLLLQWFLS